MAAEETGRQGDAAEGAAAPAPILGTPQEMLAWASDWLAAHGEGPWQVSGHGALGEARLKHGRGLAAVLELQGADPITRVLGLLVCSDPWPDQAELDVQLGEELGAYLGTLLANCQRLMSLSFSALIGSQGAPGQSQPEVLRRMTLAMARDVRVVMVLSLIHI